MMPTTHASPTGRMNLRPAADDNSCDGVIVGCIDPSAFNYRKEAQADDGSCVSLSQLQTSFDQMYAGTPGERSGKMDGTASTTVADGTGCCPFDDAPLYVSDPDAANSDVNSPSSKYSFCTARG